MKFLLLVIALLPIMGFAQDEATRFKKLETHNIDLSIPGRLINTSIIENSYIIFGDTFFQGRYKSTLEIKYLLDSVYSFNFNSPSDSILISRSYYNHDSHGKPTINYFYNWETTNGEWILSAKDEYEIDTNGDTISVSNYLWNSNLNHWVGSEKQEYEYNTNKFILLKIAYGWDNLSNNWIAIGKYEFTYSINNKLSSQTIYYWDNSSSLFNANSRYEYSYSAGGKIILRESFGWDTKKLKWVIDYIDEFTYDSKGNDSLHIVYKAIISAGTYFSKIEYLSPNSKDTIKTTYNWDNISKEWRSFSKEEYTYDMEGNKTLSILYSWDNLASNWMGSYKDERNYNADGFVTMISIYNFDKITQEWISYEKYELTYDSYWNGEISTFLYYGWNKAEKVWDCVYKMEYSYDLYGNVTVGTADHWNSDTNKWDIYKYYNYYSLFDNTKIINSSKSDLIQLFPNPTNDLLNLEVNDNSVTNCRLINSNGQIIETFSIFQGVNSYNISDLKVGIYIIQIKTAHGFISKKIIKY